MSDEPHIALDAYARLSLLAPHPCHPDVVDVFRQATDDLGLSDRLMDSGAGHDTQFTAELNRADTIFVPSVGGISHAPDEWTSWIASAFQTSSSSSRGGNQHRCPFGDTHGS